MQEADLYDVRAVARAAGMNIIANAWLPKGPERTEDTRDLEEEAHEVYKA